jgi:hypothetical protein
MSQPPDSAETQALAELKSLLEQRLAAADADEIDERSAAAVAEEVFTEQPQASSLRGAAPTFGEAHADFIAAYNRSVNDEGLPLDAWRSF